MSTWIIEKQRTFSVSELIHQFYSKSFKHAATVFSDKIEVDSKGIHPGFIEIIEDDNNLIIKGLDLNNLSNRLHHVLNKSDFSDIDRNNIAYRAGKIVFKVNYRQKI
jgi:hypothetical protein